jgi:hypothetical protein
MAKAKRQRRSSIRTMSADSSALEALESLERLERSNAETATESPEGDALAAAPREAEAE